MRRNTALIDEPPLLVMPSLAKAIGLEGAVFLQQLHYWLGTSKHEYAGERWIYNSAEQWLEQLPFLSLRSFRRMVNQLRRDGLIRTSDHLNGDHWNHTLWYTIDYTRLGEIVGSCQNGTIDVTECQNGISDSAKMALTKTEDYTETTEEDPRALFRAIQSKIVADNGPAIEFEIRNIDRYAAAFTGSLPAVDPADVGWFISYVDQIRRDIFQTDHVAPLKVPPPGLLRAVFPHVREWRAMRHEDFRASERRWREVFLNVLGSGPRDGSLLLYEICRDIPAVFEGFTQEANIVYSGVAS